MNIQEHIEEVKKALEYFSDYDPEAADNVVVGDGLVHLAAIEKMTHATPTDEDLIKIAEETVLKTNNVYASSVEGQTVALVGARMNLSDQTEIILQALKKAVQR